jgi:hypothetical protein
MVVAPWRLPVAALGLAAALILLLGGAIFEAVTVGAVVVLWFVDRAGVPESLGARFLHRRAALELVKVIVLAALVLAAQAAMFAGFAFGWNHDSEAPVLYAALPALMFMLVRDIERRLDLYGSLREGGDAEVLVSAELESLPADWVREDNWLRTDGKGNVDHVVRRPDGEWFTIETKSGRFRHSAAGQAVGCAVAVQQARHLRWVTPVVCVGADYPPALQRVGNADVWVVGRGRLAAWLPTAAPTRRR